MSETLKINITALNPDNFEKDTTSTATKATVASNGNIDLSNVNDTVVISWTLVDSLGETFRTTDKNPGPIKIRTQGNPPGNPAVGIFGSPSLTNENKTVSVTDANGNGAAEKSFSYTLFESQGSDDPSIRNQN